MHLTWMVTTGSGHKINWLHDREGGRVRIGVNAQRTAEVSVSVEENVVHRIRPGRSRLKIWCHPIDEDPASYLLFNGLIMEPRMGRRRIEISAVDQSVRLLNAYPAPLPQDDIFNEDWWENVEAEQSEVMWQLIRRSDARYREYLEQNPNRRYPPLPLGIVRGNLANSRVIHSARFADGKTTWDALVDYASRNRAPDFELEPLDRDDHIHARFNTFYPRMGRDLRDKVILEEGHNIADFSWEPSGVDLCNRYALVGKANQFGVSPVAVAESRPMSWHLYGIWQRIESAPDIDNVNELRRRAESYVSRRSHRQPFVDVTPSVEVGGQAKGWARDAMGNLVPLEEQFGIPPTFGPPPDFDYWIGDRITLRNKYAFMRVDEDLPWQGAPETDLWTRISDAEFVEVDKGANVVVELTTVPQMPRAQVRTYHSRIRTSAR